MPFRAFVILGILNVLMIGSPQVEPIAQAPELPSVNQVFETLRAGLGRIRTIRYKSVSRSTSPGPRDPKGQTVVVQRSDVRIKGPKFVVTSRVDNPQNPIPMEVTLAFDGQEYQNLDARRGALTSVRDDGKAASDSPYFGPSLITIMFTFALDEVAFRDFEALRQADLWGSIASKSRVMGRESIGSHLCVVVQVDGLSEGRSAKLYLAEDLGYYPFRVEYDKGFYSRVDTVDEYEAVVDGDATIVVPTKVTTKGTLKTTTIPTGSVLTIDPGTLEVNKPIRDSVFTLPKNQVATRFDSSTRTAYKDGETITERGDLVQVVDEPGPALGPIALWASAGLIALGVGLAVVQKFRNRGTTGLGRR